VDFRTAAEALLHCSLCIGQTESAYFTVLPRRRHEAPWS